MKVVRGVLDTVAGMPTRAAWRCSRCETLNLPSAESCRRCGALPGALGVPNARPRARRDDSGLAAVLSLLLPGLGQLYTGRLRRAAAIVALPLAIGTVIVGLLLIVGP